MADEDETTQEETTTTTEQPQAQMSPTVPQSWEEIFKHPRFAELATRAQKAEKALQELKEKTLKEQNDYKALYETKDKELAEERKNSLKIKIAASKGLSMDLVNRLQGDTEEDIQKDADTLLAFLKPATPQTPPTGVPPHSQNGQGNKFDFTAETDPAKIREQARKK